MTPYQLKLFNFISKPVLYINEDQENSNETYKRKNTMEIPLGNIENEKNIMRDVLKHFEDLKNNGTLTELEKKLLENLDQDVELFL